MYDRYLRCLVAAIVLSLLFTVGCATTIDRTAKLGLDFTDQESTTYMVKTVKEKSAIFEGSMPDDMELGGGKNIDKVEIVFEERIKSIDQQGNAVADIVIKWLRQTVWVKGKTVFNFDSGRKKDQSLPMAKLINQSYRIKISPDGKVLEIIDTSKALAAAETTLAVRGRIVELLSDQAIKQRHEIPALPAADKATLTKDDTWSSIKDFSFGMIGGKSYERIYTLKNIEKQKGRKVAIVQMQGIPSAKSAEQQHLKNNSTAFSDNFDNTQSYTGELKLDLTSGKVVEYTEKMQSEWVIVIPSKGGEAEGDPAVLKMGVKHFYGIKKIDQNPK